MSSGLVSRRRRHRGYETAKVSAESAPSKLDNYAGMLGLSEEYTRAEQPITEVIY